MNLLHSLLARLPFEWAQYAFMHHALLAVLIVSPLFALLGTLVVNNRMAFFADAIGHAAFTGLGLGVLLGLADPIWALVGFSLLLAIGICTLQRLTHTAMDTVISLGMCFSIALGVVLLSRGGGFNKFTHYLIGDPLSITPREPAQLLVTALVAGGGVLLGYNRLLLAGLSVSLARSRGRSASWPQLLFAAAIALVVTMNLRWVGLLVINSLLILPAAAARNLARNARQHVLLSSGIALFSGVAGLIASFYADTATGATIVLVAMGCYGTTLALAQLTAHIG